MTDQLLAVQVKIGFTRPEQFIAPKNRSHRAIPEGGVMYDLDARLPAHLAAAMVGVSRQLINYWRKSGRLKPVDHNGRQPLYRLGDLFDVERETRHSPQSHRCPAR